MSETFDVSHYYVYILHSQRDHKFYIGFTSNLKKRLILHSHGKVEATKNRTPLKLIHYEYFINKDDALAREKFLKSGYGRKQFAEILKITIEDISK
jgi:predicted GIY-YIG superfamily endonuclease